MRVGVEGCRDEIFLVFRSRAYSVVQGFRVGSSEKKILTPLAAWTSRPSSQTHSNLTCITRNPHMPSRNQDTLDPQARILKGLGSQGLGFKHILNARCLEGRFRWSAHPRKAPPGLSTGLGFRS